MRGFRSTLILLVVFLSLLGYLYFVESKKPDAALTADQKPKVFAIVADNVDELRIRSSTGEATALKKSAAGWTIVEPAEVAANQTEVSGIASALAALEQVRIVDENPTDLKQFGLAEPHVDVAFKLTGENDLRHLLVGDKTATGGNVYAKLANEKPVFLIEEMLDGTFNRSTFDLRDKSILKFERDKVNAIEITSKAGTMHIAKAGTDWKLVKPIETALDSAAVEGIVSQLETAQMVALLAPEPKKELKPYGLDKPDATVTVVAGSARSTLFVGAKSPDGTVYARDAARPEIFTIATGLADDLQKPASEYRRKEIFDFRPFNAARFEITRGPETVAFERVKGSGANAQDTWKEVAPASKDVDGSNLEGALLQVSNLRADAFVDNPGPTTGLQTPAATITVRFEDGKKEERVTIGRLGDDVFAARADRPGAAKLDTKAFDEAIKAIDALK